MRLVKTDNQDNQSQLEYLLLLVEPNVRASFLVALRNIGKKEVLDEIERLLTLGLFDEALGLARGYMLQFVNSTDSHFVTVGEKTAEYLANELKVVISFNQVNERAVRLMQEAKFRMISNFDAEQRKATQLALVEGLVTGTNPKQQAKAFRDSLGLTRSQVLAVNRYRSLLEANSTDALTRELRDRRYDPIVRRGLLTTQQIDKMVEAYRRNQLRHRAEVIARTESLRIIHQASQEAYRQAIDDGKVDVDSLIQEWITARDERVRGSHRYMHGQKQKIGGYFTSGDGYQLLYPGDPSAPAKEVIQCRCVLTTRLTGD